MQGASEWLAGWITTVNGVSYDRCNIVRARPCYKMHREAKREKKRGGTSGSFFREAVIISRKLSPLDKSQQEVTTKGVDWGRKKEQKDEYNQVQRPI